MNPTRVEVMIDELVLHGFAPSDRYAIAAALQSELTRLISEQGVQGTFTQNAEISHVDGGLFETKPNTNAAEMGIQTAQAIYQGVQS